MVRFLISAALAATLMLTPVTTAPVTAQAAGNVNELAKVLTGLAVLGALGIAIKKSRDDDDDDDDDRNRTRDRDRHPYPGFDRDRDRRWQDGQGRPALPAECLHRVETRRGTASVFGKRCLERNFRGAGGLPPACETRVHAYGRARPVYGARCLGRLGWTVARRN